jgi:hypothetical protein
MDMKIEGSKYNDTPYNEDVYQHFLQCKYLRQVIFGNLDTLKQMKIQVFLTQSFIKTLLDHSNGKFKPDNFIAYTSDEIFIKSTDIHNEMKLIRQIFDKHVPELSPVLKIEGFQLRHILSTRNGTVGFVKEYVDNRRPDFKKHYYRLPVHRYDRVFIYDGYLASMDTNLF